METEEKIPILEPQFLKDSHIMEYLIKRGIQGKNSQNWTDAESNLKPQDYKT